MSKFFFFWLYGILKISQRNFWISLRLLYLGVALILILSLLLQPHTRLQVNFLYNKVSVRNMFWNLNFQCEWCFVEFWFTQKNVHSFVIFGYQMLTNCTQFLFKSKSHQTGSNKTHYQTFCTPMICFGQQDIFLEKILSPKTNYRWAKHSKITYLTSVS